MRAPSLTMTKHSRLESLCEKVTVGHVGTTAKFYRDEGVPFLRTQNVGADGLKLDELKYITTDFHASQKKSQVRSGDILVSRVVTDRVNCGVVPAHIGEANCANVLLVRPSADKISTSYLHHYFRSSLAQEHLLGQRVGAAQQVVNTKVLRELPIPLPPLEEQKRIAEILDQADALRRLRTRALDKLNTLGQAIFHEMAEDLKTGEEVGFEAIADIQVGYPFKSKFYIESGHGVRLCRGANVLPGIIDWSNTAKYPYDLLGDVEQFKLREGDVILAMDRPWISSGFKVASIGQQDLPSYLVQRVARLRAKRDEDRAFLSTLVNSHDFQRHCRPTETTIPHISPLEIKSFRFRLPTEELRDRFNLAVKLAMAAHSPGMAYLSKAETLFASLQHRAFRGEL